MDTSAPATPASLAASSSMLVISIIGPLGGRKKSRLDGRLRKRYVKSARTDQGFVMNADLPPGQYKK